MKSHCQVLFWYKYRMSTEREGELGAGKPEDLPIMRDGDAITPSRSFVAMTGMGFFFGMRSQGQGGHIENVGTNAETD